VSFVSSTNCRIVSKSHDKKTSWYPVWKLRGNYFVGRRLLILTWMLLQRTTVLLCHWLRSFKTFSGQPEFQGPSTSTRIACASPKSRSPAQFVRGQNAILERLETPKRLKTTSIPRLKDWISPFVHRLLVISVSLPLICWRGSAIPLVLKNCLLILTSKEVSPS